MSRELFGLPVGVGVLGDALITGGDLLVVLFDIALATGETWYAPLAVTAGTIAPEVSWLDQTLLTQLTVLAATLYVGNVVRRRYNAYRDDDD